MKGASLGRKTYDAVTALVGGALALVSPGKASWFRYGREVYRTYTAGELSGPNQNWRPRNKNADAEIKRGYKWVLARCRDQVQNNPQISGALEKICNNVVRSGIRPQFTLKKKADGKLDTAKNDRLERLYKRWARYASIDGHDSFWAMQRLGLRHCWHDGEFLIHRVYDESLPGIVPLRLELIECDQLDLMVDGELSNGNLARRGIEFDPRTGKPVAYHLLDAHPGDYLYLSQGKTRRIPARDIIHVYDKRRISQTRGISWLVAIVMEAYDLADYKDYERIGAKLAAAFGVFVKTNYPDIALGGLGLSAGNQQGAAPVTGLPSSVSDLPKYISPGRIQALPHGTDISIASHNRPGTQYEPYVRESVRGQSTGAGMSYEAFSNDYTSASYASARSASLEERLSYRGQQFFLNEKMNDRVAAWFVEAAWLSGLAPPLPGFAADPLPYYEAVTWQDPGWTWVDPLKDANAADKMIDKVVTTRTRTAAQRGDDWEEILDESIREEEKLERLYELRRRNQQLAGGNEDGEKVQGSGQTA